jgi:serine/threonine protein kinase
MSDKPAAERPSSSTPACPYLSSVSDTNFLCLSDISESLAEHIEHCAMCQQQLQRQLDDQSKKLKPILSAAIPGYRIVKLLGRGGHATVYLAEELSTERLVALKIVSKSLPNTEELRSVWRREILLAARMDHPNLLRLFSVLETQHAFVLVFQYIAGGTLSENLKSVSTSLQAIHIIDGILSGLSHIHSMGILHLDLKPSNILIERSNDDSPLKWIAKISDFGIARSINNEHSKPGINTANTNTIATIPAGTIDFMAPEQTLGFPELLTPSTDLFGVGGILRQLTDHLQLRSTSQSPLSPASTHPLTTEQICLQSLERIAEKCLSINPSDRFQSTSELQAELADLSRQPTPPSLTSTQSQFPIERTWTKSIRNSRFIRLAIPLLTLLTVLLFTFIRLERFNHSKLPLTEPTTMSHTDREYSLSQWVADLDLPPQAISPEVSQRIIQGSNRWNNALIKHPFDANNRQTMLQYAILQRAAAERLAAHLDTRHLPLAKELLAHSLEIFSALHLQYPDDQMLLKEYIKAAFCDSAFTTGQQDLKDFDRFVHRRLASLQRTIDLVLLLSETRQQWHWSSRILDELRRSRRFATWSTQSESRRNIEQCEAIAATQLKKLLIQSEESIPEEIELRFQLAEPMCNTSMMLAAIATSISPPDETSQSRWEPTREHDSLQRELLVAILGDTVFNANPSINNPSEIDELDDRIASLKRQLGDANQDPNGIPLAIQEDLIRFVAGIASYARSQNNLAFAQSIQNHYLNLCSACQRHFPEHPSVYLSLSEAHLQSWKNELRKNNPELAVEALVRSQMASQKALDIAPEHPLANHQVADRLKRLVRFQNGTKSQVTAQ